MPVLVLVENDGRAGRLLCESIVVLSAAIVGLDPPRGGTVGEASARLDVYPWGEEMGIVEEDCMEANRGFASDVGKEPDVDGWPAAASLLRLDAGLVLNDPILSGGTSEGCARLSWMGDTPPV